MPSILTDAVELRHLRYFRALAEARSFTRAAAAIGLTQPTLSHQIQRLEAALGVELFRRGRSACRLTTAGELLLPYVQRVLGDMEALRQALDDQSGLRRGSLRVATLPVLAQQVLPQAIAAFHIAHPGIQVRVLEMTVDEMVTALAAGTVEVCIGTMDAAPLPRHSELLYEEELVAIVPAGHPNVADGTITVAEIAAQPVIVPPPGFGTRTMILQAWAKVRRNPVFALEIGSTEAVLQAVLRGGGIGVLPASALWGHPGEGWTTLRIHRPVLTRRIGVGYAPGGSPRPAADALLPFLRQAVAACFTLTASPDATVRLGTGAPARAKR